MVTLTYKCFIIGKDTKALKKTNKVLFILAVLLIFGGPLVFINSLKFITQGVGLGIYSIFFVFHHLPTSIFDLVASGITENWAFTGVIWLDTLLLNIATIIPPILIFLLAKLGLKINGLLSSIIALLVLILVLELFISMWFWISLSVFILLVLFTIIFLIRSSKNEK